MTDNIKQNKLAVMPIPKLLASMAIPMMFSFFIQAMYNIVDSMFVARISENALTAVSLAFPTQQIMGAISIGTGVGVSALVPRFMGMGDREKANRVANSGVFLYLSYAVIFFTLGLVIVRPFYEMQTDVPEIVEGGITYLRIVWMLGFGSLFGVCFEKMLTCSGFATLAMIAQTYGAVFNIIFDPLLIFGIGPFPKLGIAGAALATVLGQILAACIAFALNIRKNSWVKLSLKGIFHPSWSAVKNIFTVGFPSMITMGLSSVTSFIVNQILLSYSTTATAVYGIWMKLQNFCFMPAFGMNNGMMPILSFNYGVKSMDRVRKTLKYALMSIMSLLLVLTCVFEIIPQTLLTLFNASENMMALGLRAIRICVISLVFGGACIIMSSAMIGLNHPKYALILNIFRNFILLSVSFFLFSTIFRDVTMVWFAVPCAEIVAFVISMRYYRKLMKEFDLIEKGIFENSD